MTPEEVVRGFFADNEYPLGFVGAAEKWYHDDIVNKQNGSMDCKNKEEYIAQYDAYNAFNKRPYAKIDIKELAVVGDTVYVEWEELCYNHDSGNSYLGHLMAIMRVKDDKIIFRSDYYDQSDYKFGPAAYFPTPQEIEEYRVSLGYEPHKEIKDYNMKDAYHC